MPTNKHTIQVEGKGFGKVKGQAQGLGGAMGGLAKNVGLVAGSYFAGKGLINAFQFATRVGKEFEQSMANLKAISGANSKEMEKLSANAKNLGKTTRFTASEVGLLSVNYAKLGFSASQILKVSEATLNLASATGEDLATSSAVAGGTLRGFGLEAEQTGMLTDVMAKSFSTSALDLTKFSEAMKYVAPVSKVVGFSVQETTAILGQLANSSIDGSMAGTSLRTVLMEMSISGSKLSKVFGKSVKNFDEFVDVLQDTKKSGGLTEAQLLKIPKLLRGTIPVLIESSDKLKDYKTSLDDAGGSAQRMADIQMDTLEGKMLEFNSALEGVGIALFEMMEEPLKAVAVSLTEFAQSVDSEGLKSYATGLGVVAGAYTVYNANVIIATVSTKAFRTALISTGVGALAVGTGILIGKLIELSDVFKDTSTEAGDSAIQLGKNKKSAEELFKALESGHLTQENRKRVIGEINTKYGHLLSNELKEVSTLKDIKKGHDEVTNSLVRKIAVEQSRDKIAKIIREINELRDEEVSLISRQSEAENNFTIETDKHTEAIDKARARQEAYNKTHGHSTKLMNQGRTSMGMQIEEFENLSQATGLQSNASILSGIAMESAGFKYERTSDAVVRNQIEQGKLKQKMGEVQTQADDLVKALTSVSTASDSLKVDVPSGGGGGGDFDEGTDASEPTESLYLSDLQVEFDNLTEKRRIDNAVKVEQLAMDLAFKDGVENITFAYLELAEAKLKVPSELTDLENLQIAYDGVAEKLAVDREAKIQQIALDLAVKDGVDGVTQAYLDQAEAMVGQGEETNKTIEGLTKVGETVGVWADTVGGLYDAVYQNKKQTRDKDMAEEIKLVQKSSATEQEKNAKIQNIKEDYAQKDKDARKKMKPVKYAEAISSIALGIAKALGSAPPPFNIALAGITAVAGAVQLGTIAGSEYAKGGLLQGKSHSQGGIPINVEGGEFIMRKRAVERLGLPFMESINKFEGGGLTTTNISTIPSQPTQAPQNNYNITLSGNVMTEDFAVDQLIPAIDRAKREGIA